MQGNGQTGSSDMIYNARMNITVLDGYYMNPGDLSWEGFKSIGNLKVYETSKSEDIIPRCIDSEAVLTNKVPFTRETMERLPKLRYIGVTATGYNIIDTKAAEEMGIIVTNVPEYSTEGVVESVFAHILEFTHRTGLLSEDVHNGKWVASGHFCGNSSSFRDGRHLQFKKPETGGRRKRISPSGFENTLLRV